MHNYDELLEVLPKLSGKYIVQEPVIQCEQMNALNPDAVNTIRIVTVNNNGNVHLLTSLLRVGAKATGNVDNWAAGGFAVGIRPDGRLKKYGMRKPQYGGKLAEHPDTGLIFDKFVVPKYRDAVEMCVEAHQCLDGVHSIGWDIAVNEKGPCFIEGNDDWEISLMQACDRPLKKEWTSLL